MRIEIGLCSGLLTAAAAGWACGCARSPAPAPASAPAPAPEAVLLRVHRQPGEARRFRWTSATYVHLGPGEPPAGDSTQPMMRATTFVTESVTAASGDTFTIAFITDSNHVSMPLAGMAEASLDTLLPRGRTMTVRIDGRGHVISLQVEHPVLAEGQMATLRATLQSADTAEPSRLGAAVALPALPARVGDTWTDTTPCPPAVHGCAGGLVTTYRLDSLVSSAGRRTAVISSMGDVPRTSVDTPMAMTTGPMHMAGEERLDVESGWMVAHSLTMSGPLHSPMGDVWMRMVARETQLPGPAAAAPTAKPAGPPPPSGFLMRRGGPPAPTTLDGMIAAFRRFEPGLTLETCGLPEAAAGADWIALATPDSGYRVRLPRDWRVTANDSVFGESETVLENATGDRIRVIRQLHESGRQTLNKPSGYGRPDELPHTGPCQVGTGPAGAVWSFYAPDPAPGAPPRYLAVGSLVTAGGREYRITMGAHAAGERDRLARIVADAAQTSP
jgi:hypothetical protein